MTHRGKVAIVIIILVHRILGGSGSDMRQGNTREEKYKVKREGNQLLACPVVSLGILSLHQEGEER